MKFFTFMAALSLVALPLLAAEQPQKGFFDTLKDAWNQAQLQVEEMRRKEAQRQLEESRKVGQTATKPASEKGWLERLNDTLRGQQTQETTTTTRNTTPETREQLLNRLKEALGLGSAAPTAEQMSRRQALERQQAANPQGTDWRRALGDLFGTNQNRG